MLTIAQGSSLKKVSNQLSEAGVIDDTQLPVVGSVFYLWAHRVKHAGSALKAGDYEFKGPATAREILKIITEGQVRTYQVTIPEGLRLDESLQIIARAGLGSFRALWVESHDKSLMKALKLPTEATSLEGYLFPDTYTFAKGLPAQQILRTMVSHFEKAYTKSLEGKHPPRALSRHEAVTLASIVEKETGAAKERPRIACVFYNRLIQDWKLQTDPTVIYAKILRNDGVFDGNITKKDLEAKHPYNTYTNKGLPPGPIASPGLAALEAVMKPDLCRDMFFVARNDGTHEFCVDYPCHLKAIERYQLRRRGHGG